MSKFLPFWNGNPLGQKIQTLPRLYFCRTHNATWRSCELFFLAQGVTAINKLFESVLLTEEREEGEAEFEGKSFQCEVLIFRIK